MFPSSPGLTEVAETWTGTTWFIEGDISDCFSSLNHDVMITILAEKIHDNRFLRLLRNMLQAGYVEDWAWNATLSGAPQGGLCPAQHKPPYEQCCLSNVISLSSHPNKGPPANSPVIVIAGNVATRHRRRLPAGVAEPYHRALTAVLVGSSSLARSCGWRIETLTVPGYTVDTVRDINLCLAQSRGVSYRQELLLSCGELGRVAATRACMPGAR